MNQIRGGIVFPRNFPDKLLDHPQCAFGIVFVEESKFRLDQEVIENVRSSRLSTEVEDNLVAAETLRHLYQCSGVIGDDTVDDETLPDRNRSPASLPIETNNFASLRSVERCVCGSRLLTAAVRWLEAAS